MRLESFELGFQTRSSTQKRSKSSRNVNFSATHTHFNTFPTNSESNTGVSRIPHELAGFTENNDCNEQKGGKLSRLEKQSRKKNVENVEE